MRGNAIALDDVVQQDPDESLLDARGEVARFVADREQIGQDGAVQHAEGGDVLHGPRRGHRVVVIQDYGLARHRGRGGSQGHASSRGL